MEWIDVNKEVPKKQDILYLFTERGCFLTGYFHGEKSGFITYGEEAYMRTGVVTHWALPEPPKTK